MSFPAIDPPATSSLADLLERCGAIALFLDFDGVLAELAPTPDSVIVPPRTIAQLQSLNSALEGALAVVTGRPVDRIDALLAPLSLAVAADHGNSRRTADGAVEVLNPAAAGEVEALRRTLEARFAADPRIIVEAKPSAVALHYRLAPEREAECLAAVQEAVAPDGDLAIITGKMVVEARAAGASKGAAVHGYMQQPPFSGRTPIFVGDDVTDEDGFVAAQELGGLGIKVGDGDTGARYRIAGTREVAPLLEAILRSQERLH